MADTAEVSLTQVEIEYFNAPSLDKSCFANIKNPDEETHLEEWLLVLRCFTYSFNQLFKNQQTHVELSRDAYQCSRLRSTFFSIKRRSDRSIRFFRSTRKADRISFGHYKGGLPLVFFILV